MPEPTPLKAVPPEPSPTRHHEAAPGGGSRALSHGRHRRPRAGRPRPRDRGDRGGAPHRQDARGRPPRGGQPDRRGRSRAPSPSATASSTSTCRIFQPDMAAANLISIAAAKRYEAVPVAFIDDRTLLVAMADPANVLAVDDIALLTGKEIRPAVTSREDIAGLIARLARLDDVVPPTSYDEDPTTRPPRSSTCASPPTTRRSSGSSTRSSPRPSSRARRTSTSSPTARELRVRFRIDGVLIEAAHGAAADGARRHQPREDHERPRHLRAARAAGRSRRPDDRRPPHRPARRDAAERPRRVGRHAHPRQGQRRPVAREARHGAGREGPLRARLPPGLRRGARHRPDGLGQVDDAVRRARRAQHDREEHHHDRGPGRVPARRHHAGAGQREGRPARSRPACAR